MVLYSVLHPVQVVLFAGCLANLGENKMPHEAFLIKEMQKSVPCIGIPGQLNKPKDVACKMGLKFTFQY